jgi:hypothetical protein
MDGLTYRDWRRDIEYRAEAFALTRRPEPRQDPVRKYVLDHHDWAFIAAIDAAFRD